MPNPRLAGSSGFRVGDPPPFLYRVFLSVRGLGPKAGFRLPGLVHDVSCEPG